ncbi:hypothetical protein KY290_005544 [Solanum tuberosum]|uniref:Reverse transcriptase domain-containing protein n=1 Tax=Solanum tuberosum TaxID=4113 RepID=A0ABQ7WGX6_SOLTU|nr:hypothetical protein KY289_005931 [Solanum tuberosum]KAH0727927.1 hypothetical protein KY284_003792 [Solanum tuberosum]KAH0752422.1 hypothetical protein KY285_005570 [Solanum tuberosum]KAH0779117.1 hypothetical protein KY290_005544 [Solanum tuberosum]
MQFVMDTLIDPSQAAFVPGRVIVDNILLSHELVKGYGRKGLSPRSMMKIDMHKAYDYVEWPFIEQILRLLNFPTKFINWIMSCLTTVSYSILINGVPTTPFKAKKGLRQGDLVSPYLFVLSMEYLSRLIKNLKWIRDFKYHPKCSKVNIVQLGFADDLLLFSKGDAKSVQVLFDTFQEFSKASRLIANASKSSIYFRGGKKY